MKYLKYGYASFTKNIFSNLIIIFQLTFLFVGLNVVIGNYNSRNMLWLPYEEIFQNDGYYWLFNPMVMPDDINEDGEQKKYDDYLNEEIAKLQGDYTIYRIFNSDIKTYAGKQLRLIFVEDTIFDKLTFPTVSGGWKKSDSENTYGVISPNVNGLSTGDVVDWYGKSITISGVLTDPCYVPLYNTFMTSKSETDISMLYNSVLKESSQYDYLILPQSQMGEYSVNKFGSGSCCLVAFDPSMSQEDKEYNSKILLNGNSTSSAISFEQIRNSTKIFEKEDTQKTMPLVVCMWIVSVVGLVCSSAITTIKLLRNYALFYICGAKWRDCLLINAVSSIISVAVSAVLCFGVMKIGIVNGLSQDIGFVFKANNVVCTALLAVLMVVLSVIVPAILLKHKQPKTIISEMSE